MGTQLVQVNHWKEIAWVLRLHPPPSSDFSRATWLDRGRLKALGAVFVQQVWSRADYFV